MQILDSLVVGVATPTIRLAKWEAIRCFCTFMIRSIVQPFHLLSLAIFIFLVLVVVVVLRGVPMSGVVLRGVVLSGVVLRGVVLSCVVMIGVSEGVVSV